MGPLFLAYGVCAAHLIGLPINVKLSAVIESVSWKWPNARTAVLKEIKSELRLITSTGG